MRAVWLIGLAAFLLASAQSAGAQGLACIGKFTTDRSELDLCLYAEGGEKAGLFVIRTGHQQAKSLALQAKEWNALIALWRKAAKIKSAEWQPAGHLKDRATDEPTSLAVTAGPGVQFLLTDREGIASFILPPDDFARFDLDLKNTGRYLASRDSR